uniref:Peptidase A1 domain-containing protein n=1 Tax=Brassica oleracea TaxID=3712 RepID=A0A3P6G0L3_BRAOL|nr:unnamed protein product [Brassica oleracea]
MARLFILNPKPRPKQSPSQDQSKAFVLPVFKDTKTGIYYANVTVGKPSLVVNLAVDVRGSALWFQCDKLGYNSTTYTPILCGSNCCKQTKDQNDTCHAYLQTQMTYNTVLASLVKGDVVLSYTSPSTKLALRLPLACMSWPGFHMVLRAFSDSTSHLGGTKISNIIPYTLLETSIYKALAKAFVGKAQKRKAVYPFTDCFSYKNFGGKSPMEKETPVISLVLAGGVHWNTYGPNSLVKVKKTVFCLAFVDAGDGPRENSY